MADDDYIVILTSAVELLTHVRLYDEKWTHIIEGHPEVALLTKVAVIDTVANPTDVYDSTTEPGRTVVFVSENHTYLDNPLRVPVKIQSGTSGWIKTAYTSGGTYSGARLWSAKK